MSWFWLAMSGISVEQRKRAWSASKEEHDAAALTCQPPHPADHSRLGPHASAAANYVRARELAGTGGTLRQRFSSRWSDRYAIAHSLPENERTFRTILRGREPRRRRRRTGRGCSREIIA